MRSEISVTINH